MSLLAMLVAKLRWPRSLGALLFDTCLLDVLVSLALIAAAIKVLLFFDSGAVAFWLLLCFGS
ncbi:hypothetical protein [Variovorax sp. CCNWLW235]|uniref:hypothetical protein n=1 Tax=Variovorax sp. CCNWLW235 TaxID=3127463 RepID=UPI003078891A